MSQQQSFSSTTIKKIFVVSLAKAFLVLVLKSDTIHTIKKNKRFIVLADQYQKNYL
jgi:hypothetical protein